jgi:hypothetical protein
MPDATDALIEFARQSCGAGARRHGEVRNLRRGVSPNSSGGDRRVDNAYTYVRSDSEPRGHV